MTGCSRSRCLCLCTTLPWLGLTVYDEAHVLSERRERASGVPAHSYPYSPFESTADRGGDDAQKCRSAAAPDAGVSEQQNSMRLYGLGREGLEGPKEPKLKCLCFILVFPIGGSVLVMLDDDNNNPSQAAT